MFNYDERVFVPKTTSENGEVDTRTEFTYHQDGSILWGDYSGGEIVKGHLLGTVLGDGCLKFFYHHLNLQGEMRAGKCESTPVKLTSGKIELHEKWQWLSGDRTSGRSVIIEK